MKVLVLGGRPGNIGEAICDKIFDEGSTFVNDDCAHDVWDQGAKFITYEAPSVNLMRTWACNHLVVTLGHTVIEPFDSILERQIQEVIRGTLTLPLIAARRFVEATEANHFRGLTSVKPYHKIIFVGSYAHDHPLTHGAIYCAAKAGLAMATQELGWSMTERGFYFHIVHPYHVPETPMGHSVVSEMMTTRNMTKEEAERYQRKDLKMQEHLTKEEIADVVHWLLRGGAADWLSGQGLNLYGGSR